MAPDGQVRLQASGIRLDHSRLSLVSEGEAICPFTHPELFEPLFAAGVTRRRCAMDLGIEQRGRQRWPRAHSRTRRRAQGFTRNFRGIRDEAPE